MKVCNEKQPFKIFFIVLVILNLVGDLVITVRLVVSAVSWEFPENIVWLVVTAGILIINMPMLWIFIYKFYKPLVLLRPAASKWRLMWAAPALTGIILYTKAFSGYAAGEVHDGASDIFLCFVWTAGTYMLFCGALFCMCQTCKRADAAEQAAIMTEQLKLQEEQCARLLDSIDESSRIRHDWRHHLLVIDGLAKEHKTEELDRYITKLMPVYLNEGEHAVCENHVVNIILQHYRAMAEEKGISMKIHADIPCTVDISDIDLCIVFGNLVENAMEACVNQSGTDKFIDITAGMAGSMLAVMIKNTYEKKLIKKGEFYYSTKHEGMGMGLFSVRRTVEKYKGFMRLKYDRDYFCVNIMFAAYKEGNI